MQQLGGGVGKVTLPLPTPSSQVLTGQIHWSRQGLSTLLRGTSTLFTETEQLWLISPAITGL